jgi:serine/threonine-protein kinase
MSEREENINQTVDYSAGRESQPQATELLPPTRRDAVNGVSAETDLGGGLEDTIELAMQKFQARTSAVAEGELTTTVESTESVEPSKSGPIVVRKGTSSVAYPEQVGDYRVLRELGRGGMGVVFLAEHVKLKRLSAVKMILESPVLDAVSIERFGAEARAVASLRHENVIQLFEIGSFKGKPFFALEYVSGGTLSDRFRDIPMNVKEAATTVAALARAMQVAHENGILHRDLKPANILISDDGTPKITDFGLAKLKVDDDQNQTRTGTVMGTPCYMSPEQAQGRTSELSGATDQYSLGAILYACLSGRPPFMAASTIDTLTEVINKEPIPLGQLSESIPKDLETICLKCLEKDSEKRYSSCGELADDLQRFINDEPILARPISSIEKGWRWCRRNPKVAIPSGLAASLIAITATVSTWAWLTTSAQAAIILEEKNEANRQRIIADQQKATAQENEALAQRQAELALKNIQFIVRDVDDKLKELPGTSEVRIEILEAVSRKWDDLEVELVGGIAGEAVPTLMAVRHSLAMTFLSLDKLELAQQEFDKLVEKARGRIALKGRTDSARSNLVKVLVASSTLDRRIDHDPVKGLNKLKEAFELTQEILASPSPMEGSPSKQELLQLHAAAAMNLGVEFLRDGRIKDTEKVFSAALAAITQVLEIIRAEAGFDDLSANERDARTAGLQMELDKSKVGLAYIRLRLGDTQGALPLYEQAVASRREIFERRPELLIMKTELAGQLNLYGKSLLWINRTDRAAKVLQESIDLYQQARREDPEKVDITRALSNALYYFSTVRKLQGHDDEATSLMERCRLLRKGLFEASPDEKNRIGLMLAEARMANNEAALEHIHVLGEMKEKNSEPHLERARALAYLSQLAGGEQKTALVDQALDAIERAVDEGFSDPFRIKAEFELRPLVGDSRFKAIVEKIE